MSIFDSLDSFVSHPRVTGLATQHGRTIATLATITKKKDAYTSRLVDITDGEARTLTRSLKGESLAAIGERGEVYFTSGRKDDRGDGQANALWMLPPSGEARVVLRTVGGISSVAAAGGKLIIVASTLPGRDLADDARITKERKDRGVTAILHEDFPVRFWDHDLGPTVPQLFVADVPPLQEPFISASGVGVADDAGAEETADGADTAEDDVVPESEIELTRIELPAGKLGGVTVNPQGTAALVKLGASVKDSTEQASSVYHVDLESGEVREVAISPRLSGNGDHISYDVGEFSPDGTRAIVIAAGGNVDGQPLRMWAELWDGASRTQIAPDFDDWPQAIKWLDNQHLVMQAARMGRESLYLVDVATGEVELLTDDDYAYTNIGIRDGKIYALRGAINEAPRPVEVSAGGEVRELAELTPPVGAPGRIEEVWAKGKDGTDIRAWLWLPETEDPAPLLVFVHGGPWGSWNNWTWRWNPGPFVSNGYAVLLPDPAISIGYGQKMIDRGNDAIGDAPYTDILALVDAAEARSDISGERTALLGGSYGGYMANWMAGHTGARFSCIVSHASLWNVGFMAGTTDNGSWYEWMMPTQEKLYSPHRFADQIEVPMLIIHGDRDYRVPISQSHALWQALNRVAKVRGHKFLYFPDENHWVLKPSNSMVWYQTVMAFVNHHVKQDPWQRPELLG